MFFGTRSFMLRRLEEARSWEDDGRREPGRSRPTGNEAFRGPGACLRPWFFRIHALELSNRLPSHFMKKLAENLWVLPYSLRLVGGDLRRVVTIVRLRSGELVIHSTGPFTPGDVAAILRLGKPGWLLDAMLRHDTFAKQGREAFPRIPFLAPEGFTEVVGSPTEPLIPAPAAWGDELKVLRLEGIPSMREHVVFHRSSRTLIVADLLFNFGPDTSAWTRFLVLCAVGSRHHPGMSRPFRMAVKDKAAFQRSVEALTMWDFDRIIVGHGEIVETDGKRRLARALKEAGF